MTGRSSATRTPSADLLIAVENLARAGSTEDVVEIVRSSARRLIGSDGVALVIREDDACHYIEEDAIGPLWKGHQFQLSECISGWAMLHKQTVTVPDVFTDERIPHHLYRQTFVRSLIMAPIGHDHPIGALGAYWAQVYEPTDYEIATVETLARATANALENARLVAALSRALAQAELARDELRHRVKNAYLAAQSLAVLSLPPDYSRVFSARIAALARAHELIDQKMARQASITISELLSAELEPYGHDAPDRLVVDGPAIVLDSAQAVALGLAINELATNALKYGALATPKGRLDVHWRLDGNHLVLDWREADGPEVRTAALESFGSRLLRRLIEGQLRGSIVRRLERCGVTCTLEFPLASVQASHVPSEVSR
ncbi:sensor histidine kinase [Bradyrhizobium sp.]|uniref:sensor histidine kinase n=1 Tax=Bradyrhizobium sp. TaxID=376 RepID=UPI003C4107D5